MSAEAPEHGALGAVDEALLHELREGAHDVGLVAGGEREIRILPIAEDAEALEGLALDVDELAGVGLGTRAHLRRGEVLGFLDHFELDGQTVAVPAGDEGRMEAGHRLRFHDEVLQHLVQRGAHVHIAIREGRAVMQDELRLAGHLLHDALVKAGCLPLREALRLAGHEIGFHGKVGLRGADGVFVALFGGRIGAHEVGKKERGA